MGNQLNLKKVFLTVLIVSLCLSALVGILAFLFGNFGWFEVRVLLTTLIIGVFSLTGLCNAIVVEKGKMRGLGSVGIIVSGLALVIGLLAVWVTSSEAIIKTAFVLAILAIASAHTVLLFLIEAKTQLVKLVMNLTFLVISIISLMLIWLVTQGNYSTGQFFYKLLGVFAILDVLGTLLTPILAKVTK